MKFFSFMSRLKNSFENYHVQGNSPFVFPKSQKAKVVVLYEYTTIFFCQQNPYPQNITFEPIKQEKPVDYMSRLKNCF